MMYCAYCGKSFTRKEHLERHITSHTNVKPYRCALCQLSFVRKDLLQKHESTYHQADTSMQWPRQVPKANSRTPIACNNCASAKTACDKNVPCSRCADKNLPCTARFARRSSSAKATPAVPAATADNDAMVVVGQDISSYQGGMILEAFETTGYLGQQELLGGHPPSMLPPQFGLSMSQGSEAPHPYTTTAPEWILQENFVDSTRSESVQSWSDCSLGVENWNSRQPTFSDDANLNSYPSTSNSSAAPKEMVDVDMNSFDEIALIEEGWPLANCNPRPFSASGHDSVSNDLQNFQQDTKSDAVWQAMDEIMSRNEHPDDKRLSIVPMAPSTRDKILATAQSFLQNALNSQSVGLKSNMPTFLGQSISGSRIGLSYFALPPSNVLENLLRSYVRGLGSYYTLIHGGIIDPNEMLSENQASTLLVLLMIAQGATSVSMAEARYLTTSLTENCRITLVDLIERNMDSMSDPVVLKSALLFTILGAWGGDGRHMYFVMGQRGMYLSMLKYAGMLEQGSVRQQKWSPSCDIDLEWRIWKRCETTYRLVYNWVMVDQELGLFYDTAPILSIIELEAPIPGNSRLWLAKTASEWFNIMQETGGYSTQEQPPLFPMPGPSLKDLFQDLMHNNLQAKNYQPSAAELRLLLHPIQSLVFHLGQVLGCYSERPSAHRTSRPQTAVSTLLRQEEVDATLQRWYSLCMVNAKEDPNCSVTKASLVLYHLISLNAITSFPEIERLARKEGISEYAADRTNLRLRCIFESEKAIIHCGQILRLVSKMHRFFRPAWWAAAIYRATMILWADSILRPAVTPQRPSGGTTFEINSILPEDPAVSVYLQNGKGVPVLVGTNGELIELCSPEHILRTCIGFIDQGFSLKFSDGIKGRLQYLARNWSMD